MQSVASDADVGRIGLHYWAEGRIIGLCGQNFRKLLSSLLKTPSRRGLGPPRTIMGDCEKLSLMSKGIMPLSILEFFKDVTKVTHQLRETKDLVKSTLTEMLNR